MNRGFHLGALAQLLAGACSVPSSGYEEEPPIDTGEGRRDHAAIGGVVQSSEGPVDEAFVTSRPHGFEARTEADGSFVIDRLPPGELTLVVAHEGYASVEIEPIVVAAGEMATVEVTLAPVWEGDHVTVTVTGPDGLGVPGASVTDGNTVAPTDALGLALLPTTEAEIDLVIEGEGFWPRILEGIPAAGGAQVAIEVSGRPPEDAHEVGAATCLACHADQVSWSSSAHGRALVPTATDDLATLFDGGATLDLGAGATATLARSGADDVVLLRAASGEERSYVVSDVLGDPASASVLLTVDEDLRWVLPIGFVAADPHREPWPEAVARLVPWGVGAWFDDDGGFLRAPGEPSSPETSADAACLACHVSGFDLAADKAGAVTLSGQLDPSARWDSDGVTCERCHGPGSSHSEGGDPWLITNPKALDPSRAQDVCASCHAVTVGLDANLPYPHLATDRFQPGDDLLDFATSDATTWSSGAADVPGSQSDELAQSPHGPDGAAPLQCFDCHDPHDASGADASLRLDHRDNGLCIGCHLALDFGGDLEAAKDHAAHLIAYDPVGSEIGRCTGCHMPGTAARVTIGERSGAGDLASHTFDALSPQWTLDVFGALGADTLPLGAFPTHACAECHAYQGWREEQIPDGVMLGATGDPTLEATHEAFLSQFADRFP